jgi:hypothetical protein
MIGQHPQLAGFPELKLFCGATIGGIAATLPLYWRTRGFTHRSPGLVRALAQSEFGCQEPAGIAAARQWLNEREHWSGADVFDELLRRVTPRIGIEKSPENVESDESLERLASAYPHARFIHLTRHPVSTQRSMEKHWRLMFSQSRCRDQPMSGIGAWFQAHSRILRFTETMKPDRCLRLGAEDFLSNIDAGARRIAVWLGVRVDEEAIDAMKHPERSPFARPGPAGTGVIGGNDPEFMASPQPRPVELPGTLEPPEGWTLGPAKWRAVVDLAVQLGYQDGKHARAQAC